MTTRLRTTWRRLLADPLGSLIALGSLALALAATAVASHLIQQIYFASPPGVHDPAGLARVFVVSREAGGEDQASPRLSPADAPELAGVPGVASAAAAFESATSLGAGEAAEPLRLATVSSGYFATFGLVPAAGRLLGAQDDDGSSVVVISHELWFRRWGGRPEAVGSGVTVAGRPVSIVGVAPAGFRGVGREPVDAWAPALALEWMMGTGFSTNRNSRLMDLVIRRDPNLGLAALEAALTARYVAAEPERAGGRLALRLAPLPAGRGLDAPREARLSLWMAGLAALVLVAAAMNVGQMLLARALARRREAALETALGAPRWWGGSRAAAEAGLLVGVGGALGLAAQPFLTAALRQIPGLPQLLSTDRADLATWLTCGAAAVLAALAAALLPGLAAGRAELASLLSAGVVAGAPPRRLRRFLMAAQVAVAGVLLVVAGTFWRDLATVRAADLGFALDGVLVATANLARAGVPRNEVPELWRQAEERVRRLPGIAAAGRASTVPFYASHAFPVKLRGQEREFPAFPGGGPYITALSPAAARALGLRVLRGRGLDETDLPDRPNVALVSESLARAFGPDVEALGAQLEFFSGPRAVVAEVVGVVAETKRQNVLETTSAQIWVPSGQDADGFGPGALLVRVSSGDARGRADGVRRELQALDPRMPYVTVRPLLDLVAPGVRTWRLGFYVFGAFAAVAALLVFTGLFAGVARSLVEREREFATRIALGASAGGLVGRLLREQLVLAAGGLAVALPLAGLALDRLAPSLLLGPAWDARVMALAAFAVGGLVLVATYLAARRLVRFDPMSVLRRG